jgi:hypothetical protein
VLLQEQVVAVAQHIAARADINKPVMLVRAAADAERTTRVVLLLRQVALILAEEQAARYQTDPQAVAPDL